MIPTLATVLPTRRSAGELVKWPLSRGYTRVGIPTLVAVLPTRLGSGELDLEADRLSIDRPRDT